MIKGFTFKCNQCGCEVKVNSYWNLGQPNYENQEIELVFSPSTGISIKCNRCRNQTPIIATNLSPY